MPLKTVRWIALAAALLAPLLSQAKDFALVVHKANRATNITLKDFQKMLKAGATQWPGGGPVRLVLMDQDSAEMKPLLEKLGATPDAKGLGERLIVVTSDKAVVETVARTPGALGIIDVYSINGEVTVVKLEGKLPLEPGYPLHK